MMKSSVILAGLGTGAVIAIVAVVALILIIALSLVSWWIGTYNKFKRAKVKIEEARSSIDIALNKRFDLLTKMFDITKGYAKHEKETLKDVIGMRSGIPQNADIKELQNANNQMTEALKQINLVVERYPDLKANTVFLELQASSRDVEENLQAVRRMYNSNVSYYNQLVEVFPSSIVARHYHFEKEVFFQVEESKRADVKLDF